MRKYATAVFLLLCAALFINCSSPGDAENVKDYYFPYKNFSKGIVYKYINQNDTAEVNIWDMSMQASGADTLFLTDIYDEKQRLSESLTEVILKEGAYMQKYSMGFYNSDSVWYQVESKVKQKDIYKWNIAKGGSYIWAIEYNPGIDLDVTESKTRNYTGEKTTIDFENKKVECLIYKDTFKVEYNDGGEDHLITYSLTCYYGKGYGLLRYTTHLPNGKIKDFKLVSIR